MDAAHSTLLIVGAISLLAILAGVLAGRVGTPALLVFLGLGMLAGEDGPGGIQFDDFEGTYLAGSLALVVILVEGGLKTPATTIRAVFAPALALASAGVVITAGVVGTAAVYLMGVSWPEGLLLGALLAPTDAAAVTTVLRASGLAIPHKIAAVLEVESGINDPVSVVLTVLLVEAVLVPGSVTFGHAAGLLGQEMGLGLAFGLGGGLVLREAVRRLRRVDTNLHPVLLLAGALTLFAAAQMLHGSGFLAVYVAAVVVAEGAGENKRELEHMFEGFAWIAQIGLFIMLGLLVTPHDMLPLLPPCLGLAAVLMFCARPLAAAVSLLPFGFSLRHTAFVGWVGLRGGVPIYLAMIPVLEHASGGERGFDAAFAIVITSLAVQGWTLAPVARWLKIDRPAPQ